MLHWRYDRWNSVVNDTNVYHIARQNKKLNNRKKQHTACGAYKSVPNNDCKKENYAISEIAGKNTKKEKKRNR